MLDAKEHYWICKAQWAGEDGLPFPKIPDDIGPDVAHECLARYSWQKRKPLKLGKASAPEAQTLQTIQAKQHQACGKVWEQHESGKLTLDQAIEAAHRTQVAMSRELGKLGYVN